MLTLSMRIKEPVLCLQCLPSRNDQVAGVGGKGRSTWKYLLSQERLALLSAPRFKVCTHIADTFRGFFS